MTVSQATLNLEGPLNPRARLSRYICRFVALLCLITGAIAIVGGHPLTLFKSFEWVYTSSPQSSMTLWGVCPRGKAEFLTYSKTWVAEQNSCVTIFAGHLTADGKADDFYIDFGRRVAVSALHVLGYDSFLLAFLFSFKRHFSTAMVLSLVAFLFQGVGFSLATYEFYGILQKVRSAGDLNSGIGPGLYASGVVCVGYVIAANLFYYATKENRAVRNYAKV